MQHLDPPLAGRTPLVTGVSRRKGIGYAVARELARLGADVVTHHHVARDVAGVRGQQAR